MYLLYRECIHFAQVRAEWLTTPHHLALARARTVMVYNLPQALMSSEALRGIAQKSGSNSVQAIWLSRHPATIEPIAEIWEARDKECTKLEGGEADLLALAAKNERKGKAPHALRAGDAPPTLEGAGNADFIARYVPAKKMPSWKLGFLGLFGEKHTLDDSPAYIKLKNDELEERRSVIGFGAAHGSHVPSSIPVASVLQKIPGVKKEKTVDTYGNVAFIRFGNQAEAHAFAKLIGEPSPEKKAQGKEYKVIKSGIEVVPEVRSVCIARTSGLAR